MDSKVNESQNKGLQDLGNIQVEEHRETLFFAYYEKGRHMNEEDKQSFLSDDCETYADLEAAHLNVKDPQLAAQLKRLSRTYRKPPKGDKQQDLFEPALMDVSTKDDISWFCRKN